MIIFVVRVIFGITLLVFAWHNAHWSVALGLTLSACYNELSGLTIMQTRKELRELKSKIGVFEWKP